MPDRLPTILSRVEDGFAQVNRLNGRSIGTVSREKFGSTRTGTRWVAMAGSRELGRPYSRTAAIALVADHAADRDAQVAAFRAAV